MARIFGELSNHGVAVATAGLGRVAPSGDWLELLWSTTTAQRKLDFAARKNNFAVVDQAVTTQALLGDWFVETKKLLKWHKLGRIVKSRCGRGHRGFGARSPKWRLVIC